MNTRRLACAAVLCAMSPPALSAGVILNVTVRDGHLYVDGRLFTSTGIAYNPTYIGSDNQDVTAPAYDVPAIARIGANNVVTYIANKFEWAGVVYDKYAFQDAVSDSCDAAGICASIGFWAPSYIDYTNPAIRSQWASFYKEMVERYRSRPSTLMYVLGNEVISHLPGQAQKEAYATWLEELVQWTHANDPNHPVCYADAGTSALSLLQANTPSLDIYGTNYYEFETAAELSAYLSGIEGALPNKAIFLHEYGSDSYDNPRGAEDGAAQAARIRKLVWALLGATDGHNLIGGSYFEFSDEWKFMGGWGTQDPGNNWGWRPESCFDSYADEDYWGIARAADRGQAANRVLKVGYYALGDAYGVPEPASVVLLALPFARLTLKRRRSREAGPRPTT